MITNERTASAWCHATGIHVAIYADDPRTTLPKGAWTVACRAIEKLVNAEKQAKARKAGEAMKLHEDQLHPPRVISGPLYVKQAEFPAFAKTPAYEEALAAGRTIHVIRPDGSCAMQVCCPQDRLPCCDDLDHAESVADATNARLGYVERLEAENLRLRETGQALSDRLDEFMAVEHPSFPERTAEAVRWPEHKALVAALAALGGG